MSYIDKNLLSDEKIIFRTKKHVIMFFWPVVLLVFAIYSNVYMVHHIVLNNLVWLPWVVVFLFFSYVGLDYLTSEFAVSNKRIMMREGFFTRHTNEMRLTAISQVNVDQSLLGQILNYGVISINAFGAFDAFPLIAKPFEFQRHVNEQLDKAMR